MSPEEAIGHYDGLNDRDCRPRLKDGNGDTYLLDTGSMCCVWPASPTDKPDRSISLKTVDGSPFLCYGRKELNVRIGRKNFNT